MLTIDKEYGKNMVVWERQRGFGIKYYKIFRESSSTNRFDPIGEVNFTETTVFVDMASFPEQQQYRYKISAVDSAGNESQRSKYHQPLFLQYNGNSNGVNLIWQSYLIEGTEYVFDRYQIYRGSDSIALTQIDSVSANFNMYTDHDAQSMLTRTYYRISGVRSSQCVPADLHKAESGPFVHSISNLEDNRLRNDVDGIQNNENVVTTVYPNPTNDAVYMQLKSTETAITQVEIFDMLGKKHTSENINTINGILKINMSNYGLSHGIYQIKISQGQSHYSAAVVYQ